MDNFLETVLLTLYGDAFSPREEYLILELFRFSLNNEMKNVKNVRDFLKADSVVPQVRGSRLCVCVLRSHVCVVVL
jgi:Ras GTPase-activating-like protein IQGAP2/3